MPEEKRFTMSAVKYPIGTRWKMKNDQPVDVFPWGPEDAPFQGEVDGHTQWWDKDGKWVRGNFGSSIYDLVVKISNHVQAPTFSPDAMGRPPIRRGVR